MLTIGLLGGMSWVSSALYYRLVNEAVRDRLGELHSAKCVLASVDFAEIQAYQAAGRWADAGDLLAARSAELEAAGAEVLILCTNTMHKVADQIEAAVTIPFLHIVDVAAAAAREAGLDTVGLIGTAFTMEDDFYLDRLARHGLRVLTPDPADRALVHRIIFEELCVDVFTDRSRAAFREVIARLARSGAQGVVLGCTEIELLIAPSDSPITTFPMTRLHAEAVVDYALRGGPI